MAAADTPAGRMLEILRSRSFDTAEIVVILSESGTVAGTVALARLLELDASLPLSRVMQRNFPIVHPETDQEKVASLALHYHMTAVPVVDSRRRLLGVVPAQALLGILRREHIEDLHRLAGIGRESAVAIRALEAPPLRRARHRLPWLLVGLAGSVVAAFILAQFEGLLSANLALAFFVPGIVYLADAIGTQTEAVVVRGLSLSHTSLRHMLAGELRTGLLIGAVLGVAAFAFTWMVFDDARLAITVAGSLFAAGGIATTVGLLLPWLLQSLGADPAYGSGPLATIAQDILSIAIYLLIAQAMLT